GWRAFRSVEPGAPCRARTVETPDRPTLPPTALLPPAPALSSCKAAAKPPLLAGCAVPTRRGAAGLTCVGSIFIYARRIFLDSGARNNCGHNGALSLTRA